jgi:glycerol-3-phosphate acyltransferase PlsX
MVKIALDAMGGDHAPAVVVEGALLAAKELGVQIALVGQRDLVERELARHSDPSSSIEVVAAAETVAMDESPSTAVRKKDSSMKVAIELVKRGEAQAVVSAGNSGAMMATGMFVLGKLPGVDRPAILVVVPTSGKGTVIIDAGANVDCKPQHLLQFGLMGAIYAERVLGIGEPRVGILSNGEEEGKGNDLTRAASQLLSSSALKYIGYVEGRDIFAKAVDVVVCDGFTGNVALKTMEGVASFVIEVLKEAFQQSVSSRLGYLLSRRSLLQAYNRLDHTEHGGALLLGLDGVGIIAHGGSDSKAIKNAIRVAHETVSQDVNRRIVEGLVGLGEITEDEEDKLPRKLWQHLKAKIGTFNEEPTPEQKRRESKSGGKD